MKKFLLLLLLPFAAFAGDDYNGGNIKAGTLPLTAMKTQAANTVVGNCTGSTAVPTACSASSARTSLGAEATANKDAVSGYAGLDSSTRLKTAEFPAFTGDCPTTAGGVVTACTTAIARTGSDINTSGQVTVTHLASPLPVNQGGSGAATLTGVVLGNGTSAETAVALPADATKYLNGTGAFTVPASGGSPGGSSGQIQYNNAGAFGGFAASGDATINTSTGVVANTGLNGVSLSSLATGFTKNTTGTGAPSIATFADFVGTDATVPVTTRASVKLNSAYTNATSSFTSTNLTINLAASTAYQVHFIGAGSNDTASDGAQFTALLSAATGCSMSFNWVGQAATTTAASRNTQTTSGANTATWLNNVTPNTVGGITMDGEIDSCTGATALTIQGKNVTGGTITLNAHSLLWVEKMGGGV